MKLTSIELPAVFFLFTIIRWKLFLFLCGSRGMRTCLPACHLCIILNVLNNLWNYIRDNILISKSFSQNISLFCSHSSISSLTVQSCTFFFSTSLQPFLYYFLPFLFGFCLFVHFSFLFGLVLFVMALRFKIKKISSHYFS